jgi:hypothetical protein
MPAQSPQHGSVLVAKPQSASAACAKRLGMWIEKAPHASTIAIWQLNVRIAAFIETSLSSESTVPDYLGHGQQPAAGILPYRLASAWNRRS